MVNYKTKTKIKTMTEKKISKIVQDRILLP